MLGRAMHVPNRCRGQVCEMLRRHQHRNLHCQQFSTPILSAEQSSSVISDVKLVSVTVISSTVSTLTRQSRQHSTSVIPQPSGFADFAVVVGLANGLPSSRRQLPLIEKGRTMMKFRIFGRLAV